MRNPVRSESDAFRLTITTAMFVVFAGLVGWLTSVLVGVFVFMAVSLLALGVYLRSTDRERQPLREAASAPHRHASPPGLRHVLVVAHAPLAGTRLLQSIESDSRRVELDVLAPVRTSRTHLAYTDIDRETALARRRLARSMAWARDHGLRAHGEIGDPGATTAIEDRLRDSGADEVIVVTSHGDPDHWQEKVELERLREELEIPVVHVASKAEA
jgi:hypothetical protein